MRMSSTIIIMIVCIFYPASLLSLEWPFGREINWDNEGPQQVTSTFGEYRPPSGDGYYENDHFHNGVDILPLSGVSNNVYGVGAEYVWYTTGTSVHANYHDFLHLTNIQVNSSTWLTDTTIVALSYDDHLHFTSRAEYQTGPETGKNPLLLSGYEAQAWTCFEPLYTDIDDPTIEGIFFTIDGSVIDNLSEPLPSNTDVDIIVHASEFTTYPEGADPNNGVYKLMYRIDDQSWDTSFIFKEGIADWDIYCVYDTHRTHIYPHGEFYYIVTNGMDYNGSWYTGEGGGWHTIHVKVEDEQGNDDEDSLDVYVFSSGVDEEKPDKFDLFVKSLNSPSQATEISYSLPKKSKVDLNIYDSMGRVLNTLVNKEQKAGIYTVKWNGKNKLNNILPNGIYFCNLRAEDFEANKKIVLLGY